MLIQGLRVFDQVMALTGGGPGGATETLATQVYKETFALANFGFGAALALMLTAIILVFSVLQQLATRERSLTMFRYTKATALREALVWIVALLSLLPFYFLVSTALKPDEELLTTTSSAPPSRPTVANFTEVLTASGQNNILLGLMNSVVITVGSILGLVVFGSLAAYVLARTTRRWGSVAFYLFLVAIILPTQLGLIPLYIGARTLGLVGTPWGMIILYVGTLMPLAVFLYAGFFRGLPRDYEEAAAIDGAGPGRVFAGSCCR